MLSARGGYALILSSVPRENSLRLAWPWPMWSNQTHVQPDALHLSKIHHAAFDAHLVGIDPVKELVHVIRRQRPQAPRRLRCTGRFP
jgi:hypothetical protein